MGHPRRLALRLLRTCAPVALGASCALALGAAPAEAAEPAVDPDEALLPTQSTIPPGVGNPFIQYGVAFTTEFVATAGSMCATPGRGAAPPPCILGSGGGIVFPRIGYRSSGAWYFGGAYELSKQDANTLYQLAILQQLRGEARYYFLSGQVMNPWLGAALGLVGYGNEWAIDTFGPAGSLTLGVEAQLSRGTVIGFAFNYRAMYFRSFVDSADVSRQASVAQLLGLDIQLEVRDPY